MTASSVDDGTRTSAALRTGTFLLIIVATVLVYLPGLSGPFVFDDFGSLSRLGDLGGIRDWATFKAFVLSGDAGPSGRPLALLTFVLDGTNWPTDPLPFKRTNLVIHLTTGGALYLCARQILALVGFAAQRASRVALVTTALWLLHPFLVSTTLYAVQRMAQLATLFVLLGLATYLYGRQQVSNSPLKGYLTMTAGVGLGTLLATLSKENGVLLPLLVLLTETVIVLNPSNQFIRLHRIWTIVFLWAPVLVVLGYLASYVNRASLFGINLARGYSIYERLLTEARILVDYLWHWFVPVATTTGVFQDHVTHSTGVLEPATTMASIVFHALAVGGAVAVARRMPLVSFAVLFFYGAHLIESSVINLELYFEHRNYLAAAFLFLPVVAYLDGTLNRRLFTGVMLVFAVLFATLTTTATYGWRSYPVMVETAALRQPESMRAQQQYALQLYNDGRPAEAFAVLDAAAERRPENVSVRLTRVLMTCQNGSMTASDFDAFARFAGRLPYDPRLLNAHETLVNLVLGDSCPAVSADALYRFYKQLLTVPETANPRSVAYFQVQYFLGLTATSLERIPAAVSHFEASFGSRPTASRAMLMASILARAEAYEEAMAFTDIAVEYVGRGDTRVNAADIEAFQDRLRDAMNEASSDGPAR